MSVNHSDYKNALPFKAWVQKTLPTVYDDSLSYADLLYKVLININTLTENNNLLTTDMITLYSYVNDYFDNLDVQEEINTKLEKMYKSGQLDELFKKYLDPEIENLQNQLTTSLNEQNSAIKVLKSRMDTFTSLQEGSTTGDAELIDGRISYDGRVYDNIGGAIRGQASELKNGLDDLCNRTLTNDYGDITNTFSMENCYYAKTDGSKQPAQDCTSTGLISVNSGEKFRITGTVHLSTALIVEFNSNKTFMQSLAQGYSIKDRIINYEYEVPSGVAYVAFTSIYEPLKIEKYGYGEINKCVEQLVDNTTVSQKTVKDITNELGSVNAYIANTTGGLTKDDNAITTGLLKVKKGDTFYITGKSIYSTACVGKYNIATTAIGSAMYGSSSGVNWKDEKYVVDSDDIEFVRFSSYGEELKVKKEINDSIKNIVELIYNGGFKTFDTNIYQGKYLAQIGALQNDPNGAYSDKIFLTDFDYLYVSAKSMYSTAICVVYDSSDTKLVSFGNATNTDPVLWDKEKISSQSIIDSYQNASYIRLGTYMFNDNPLIISTKKQLELVKSILRETNILYGKTIAFEGDSIMAGDGYAGGFAKIIANNNSMIYKNNAVGGATIVSGTVLQSDANRHWISTSFNSLPEYDYVIFEGGVNDFAMAKAHGEIQLGTISENFTDNFVTEKNFCGALEHICYLLRTKYVTKKVGYVFTHKIFYDELWYNTWKPTMIKIFEKWGVPYLDLESVVPPLNMIESLKNTYTNAGDGWHPNKLGYENYYVPYITEWLKTL